MHPAEALPGPSLDQWHKSAGEDDGPVLTDEQKSRIQAMKPMTKEEWDARQSVIRKVVDPETGRTRCVGQQAQPAAPAVSAVGSICPGRALEGGELQPLPSQTK